LERGILKDIIGPPAVNPGEIETAEPAEKAFLPDRVEAVPESQKMALAISF